MAEYEDLVKRLRGTWSMSMTQGDNPQLSELEMTDEPSPVCLEAAEAIERLEAELQQRAQLAREAVQHTIGERDTAIKLCEKAERQLAEARAEIERKDREINRAGAFLSQGFVNPAIDKLKEALAAPAREPKYEVTSKGGITVVHTKPSAAAKIPSAPGAWSGTRSEAEALGYLSSEELTPEREAERRVNECKADNYDELLCAYQAQMEYIEQLEHRLDNAAQQQAPESE